MQCHHCLIGTYGGAASSMMTVWPTIEFSEISALLVPAVP